MPEPLRPMSVPRRTDERADRLDSWKEIAAYLGREVRTVQGWEKNEALPIHRHQHARLGSVYAFKPELDAWREGRKGVVEPTLKTASHGLVRALVVVALLIPLAILGFVFSKFHNASPAVPALSSVVVLPFLDLSPQKDQDYFSDGLTEEIIDAHSRVPNLRVVARTSAFAFKGKANDIRQIGQQLNVNAVLEGSVRKDGDQLRITAQLNRVSDGTHLWSRTFERQFRDIFAVQREISQSIAHQAHTSLGIVKLDYEWDREGAQREFLRAMQLNPGSGYVHHWYAHSLEAQNRLEDATREMRAAHDLDPLSVVMYWDIGNELIWARKFDEAAEHLKKASESERRALDSLKAVFAAMPQMPAGFLDYIGAGAAHEGRLDDARRTLDQLEQRRPKEYVELVLVLDLCAAAHDHKCLARWLERGQEERSALWVYLPLLKPSLTFDAEAEAQLAKYH